VRAERAGASGLGLQFLLQGLRNGAATGAVWPSGRPLVDAMVAPALRRRGDAGLRILEVGAGVGPISTELGRRMRPDDHLDVAELNPTFCATLRSVLGHLPNVRVHEGDVLHYDAEPYDHVVSALPIANFPAATARAVYVRLLGLLRPGGTLVSFQHVGLRRLVAATAPRDQRARMHAIARMERALAPLVVERRLVARNLPPSWVIVRRRPDGDPAALLDAAERA
jgi:phosphatidylethanolamine/phosphatidyl-N-methylethanolamine N-methyltransferase